MPENKPVRPPVLCLVLPLLVSLLALIWITAPAGQAQSLPLDSPDCSLLDDPLRRGIMSPAFELMLLDHCGRLPELAASPVMVPSRPKVGLAPEIAPAGGIDARVNAVDPADVTSAQSETSIAINADTGTICVTYNDIYHNLEGLGISGFSRSTDGGVTWADGGAMPPGPGNMLSRGDPSVAWRALDGCFYYASLDDGGSGANGMSLWRSTDDCATFHWYTRVSALGYEDKEMLTFDNSPDSPYYGRGHIAWLDLNLIDHFASYSDNGSVWSPPLLISDPSAARVGGAWPAVAPNGDVYIGWVRWDVFPDGPIDQEIVRSTDGGASYTPVTNPLDNAVVPTDVSAREYCFGWAALNGFILYLPSIQIAVGPGTPPEPGSAVSPDDYCLHATYPYDPDGYGVGDVINVYYRRSCDKGASWEPERLVNDDGGLTDQFYPTIAANQDGIVAISWYDRRSDPEANYLFERYWTVSYDGGDTWEPNERIGDVASPVYIDTLASCYHGHYDMMAADPDYAYLVWADDRVFFNGHYDQDVWFDKAPLWPDFRLLAEPQALDICAPAVTTATIGVGSIAQYNEPITLSDAGVPAGVSTGFETNPITPLPGSSLYTIEVSSEVGDGYYDLVVSGSAGPDGLVEASHGIALALVINHAIPDIPVLLEPADGSLGVPLGHVELAWQSVPEATAYRLQVDDDPAFASPDWDVSGLAAGDFTLEGPLEPGILYYWRVAAANACGETAFSEPFSFATSAPCVLLVDDDSNHPDMRAYYARALDDLGYAYHVFDVGGGTGDGPTLAELELYPVVIWFTGDKVWDGAGPGPGDELELASYLDNGGCLFLSSQGYLTEYGLGWFGQTYLGISYYSNDAADPRVLVGQSDDPIGEGLYYFPTYPPDFVEQGDGIYPAGGASDSFRDRVNVSLAIDKAGGDWQTVFFANSWAPTAFLNPQDGEELMGRIIDWFGGCVAPPAILVEPLSLGAALSPDESVAHTLWITNVGGTELSFALHEVDNPPNRDATETEVVPQPQDRHPDDDLPWVGLEPTSGELGPGQGQPVSVVFDSAGLEPGEYSGLLDVESTDPFRPHVTVPLTLAVLSPCQPIDATDFSWTPTSPTVGQVITFTGEATGTQPITFTWDLGDGTLDEGAVVTHTYAFSGSYQVVMTATNDCSDEAVDQTITIVEACIPAAVTSLVWAPFTPSVGEAVTFAAEATGTVPLELSWAFGDGGQDIGPLVTHTYAAAGGYLVEVTAANDCGTGVAHQEIEVFHRLYLPLVVR